MKKLERQTVIITGASSGIGEASAKWLAREGAAVVLAARRRERLDELKHQIQTAGGQAIGIAADITSAEDRSRIVSETLEAFGRIDGLVNNAGYGQRGPIEPFGIKVVVIEPGFILTEFLDTATERARDIFEHQSVYSALFEGTAAGYARLRKMAGTSDDIAKLVLTALTASNPRARYAAPRHAKLALFMKRLLPQGLFDYVLSRQTGVNSK